MNAAKVEEGSLIQYSLTAVRGIELIVILKSGLRNPESVGVNQAPQLHAINMLTLVGRQTYAEFHDFCLMRRAN